MVFPGRHPADLPRFSCLLTPSPHTQVGAPQYAVQNVHIRIFSVSTQSPNRTLKEMWIILALKEKLKIDSGVQDLFQ